jgi:hypothetical protein
MLVGGAHTSECGMTRFIVVLTTGLVVAAVPSHHQQHRMTFFITSVGSGDGANLGGLAGADRHCQMLAQAADAGDLEWHAYLSTITPDGTPAANARDRIGTGPWYNAKGVMIAESVADLHSDDNKLNKQTALTEQGDTVNGRGDRPNMHDMLTGSNLDGTAFTAEGYTNCYNWTSSGEGTARLGHHDRVGGGDHPTSWNSAHNSRGCSQANLVSTGGAGLFYCFAVD